MKLRKILGYATIFLFSMWIGSLEAMADLGLAVLFAPIFGILTIVLIRKSPTVEDDYVPPITK